MRAFACPHCSSLIFFQNSVCVTCNSALGFDRAAATFVRLEPTPAGVLGHRSATGVPGYVCANLDLAGCNWLAGSPGGLCDCCSLTRTRPADSDAEALLAFARTERAKRRLLFQLDGLGLPTTPRSVDPAHGLAFDLLSSSDTKVITGHEDGVITIDLAEGDDPHREALRTSLGEPYRTLLGHLRHEIGHWYFDVFIDGGPALEPFRALFGDERRDYGEALAQHYGGPRTDAWRATHVSDYAASHPWEDWAEVFAHYLHLTDTLQTSYAYGLDFTGPRVELSDTPAGSLVQSTAASMSTSPKPSYASFDDMLNAWLSLTFALNAVNRSMGSDDLYPFVLVPAVIEKLRFVHDVISAGPPAARDH
ncbi:putative zinc-binding metallopeptidase [soil metagenome]|jgi:hypothetical protein